jgi:hypothetical protein
VWFEFGVWISLQALGIPKEVVRVPWYFWGLLISFYSYFNLELEISGLINPGVGTFANVPS